MAQKMYVDVNEIMKDWRCSRAKGYQIIAELNAQLLKMNPHSIIIQGNNFLLIFLKNLHIISINRTQHASQRCGPRWVF